MHCFVALVALWAVVSVVSCQLCGVPLPPPSEIECLPDVLPEPEPVPIIGLLTTVVNTFIVAGQVAVNQVEDLLLNYQQDVIGFVRETGPPGIDECKKLHHFQRQTDAFWQNITAIKAEMAFNLELKLREVYGLIERAFSLVIDQPQVRSWLREFRDLSRIAKNQFDESAQIRRAQFDQLVQLYNDIFDHLIERHQCANPTLLQKRFYRVIDVGLSEQAEVIHQLMIDADRITVQIIRRGFDLADNIYQVGIVAFQSLVQ